MTRSEILTRAAEIVCGEREQQYGKPEDNFAFISYLWNTYLSIKYGGELPITESDIAIMMILLKVARIATGKPKDDNWIDIAGYAACGGEME